MPGVEKTGSSFRYRVRDPGGYQRMRTGTFQKSPVIKVVWGVTGDGDTEVQSLIFPLDAGWTEEKVRGWLAEHKKGLSLARKFLRMLRPRKRYATPVATKLQADHLTDQMITLPNNVELVLGKRIQIMPALRLFHASWGKMDISVEALEAGRQNAIKNKIWLVIDYDHASSQGGAEGGRAAGWIDPSTMEFALDEHGVTWLTGVPAWTKRAAELIRAGEFMYISPEFSESWQDKYSDGKQGLTFFALALTNRPFLPGQRGVALSEGWKMEDKQVDERLKKLLAFLKLSDTATADDVSKKLTEVSEEQRKQLTEAATADVLKALGVKSVDEAKQAIAKSTSDDGTVKLSREEHQQLISGAKLAIELDKQLKMKDAEAQVTKALGEGKITSAQREWALKMASEQPEMWKTFAENAKPVIEFGERGTGGGALQPTDHKAVMADIKRLADERMKANTKLSEAQAQVEVLNNDPSLRARYYESLEVVGEEV